MRMLKNVLQKNRNSGCGPAVVATLAGIAYEAGRMMMFPDGRTRDLGSDYRLLRLALTRLNIEFGPKTERASVWGEITGLAVVSCTRTGQWHHWVVYDPESQIVYDPYYPDPTPVLFSRQRPLSFLRVTLPDEPIPAAVIKMRPRRRAEKP